MNLEVSQKLSNVVSKLYLSIISGHHHRFERVNLFQIYGHHKKLALMAR
jgi:hypothetical protein